MLPKSQRLTRSEFIKVKKLGKNYSFPHFSVIIYLNSSTLPLFYSKYSIVTSSKFSKNAVIRNRFRRQIYPLLKALPPTCWLILYPKPSMLKLTSDQISSLLATTISPLLVS
jgi:ribonuclease P protein component